MRRAIRRLADRSKPTIPLVGAGPNEGGARIVATRSPRERLALLGTEGIAQKRKIKNRQRPKYCTKSAVSLFHDHLMHAGTAILLMNPNKIDAGRIIGHAQDGLRGGL